MYSCYCGQNVAKTGVTYCGAVTWYRCQGRSSGRNIDNGVTQIGNGCILKKILRVVFRTDNVSKLLTIINQLINWEQVDSDRNRSKIRGKVNYCVEYTSTPEANSCVAGQRTLRL